MRTRCILLLLITAGVHTTSWVCAQTDTVPGNVIKVVDGKKYYVHTVAKTETLYGISRRFGVEVKEIVLENPLTINGLKVGETIKIPVPVRVVDPMALDGKFIYHKVQPGETYYSLSRQYGISVETIDLANPEIIGSIKAGSTVRIPVLRKATSNASLLQEVLEGVDTALKAMNPDSLTPDTIEQAVKEAIMLKDSYEVALMLPLYLDINDSLEVNRNTEEPVQVYQKSIIGLDFYQGAMVALDSLRRQGYKARVTVYDTERDTGKIKELTHDPKLPDMDLIIGPLYRSNLAMIRQFAIEHKIHVVSPFIATNKILIGNECISKVKPAVQTCVEEIATYISNEFMTDNRMPFESKNLILVHNGDPGEKMLCELFKQRTEQLYLEADTVPGRERREIRVVEYLDREMQAVEEALSLADTNILVVLSRDQVFVSRIIAQLHRKCKDYSVVVFGLPVWEYFLGLESKQLLDLNVHIASAEYVDYGGVPVKDFVRHFQEKYKVYPGKYAFDGFDVTYYYLQMLKKYGCRFSSYLPESEIESLKGACRFEKLGVGSGYENKRVYILKYEDYDLVLKHNPVASE